MPRLPKTIKDNKERHLIYPTSRGLVYSNFTGPNTMLNERRRLGDKYNRPTAPFDECSKKHDYAYKKIDETTYDTKEDLNEAVFKADNDYRRCLKSLPPGNPIIKKLLSGAFLTKRFFEKVKIWSPRKFVRGKIKGEDEQEKQQEQQQEEQKPPEEIKKEDKEINEAVDELKGALQGLNLIKKQRKQVKKVVKKEKIIKKKETKKKVNKKK